MTGRGIGAGMDETRWRELSTRLRLELREDTRRELLAAYGEPHRAYHSARHVEDCLAGLDRNRDLADDPDAVEMAIWFHDAIYRPYSSSNEADSAAWASEFLVSAGAGPDLVADVSRLILATRHDVAPGSRDASLLVDVDLAVLGSEPAAYARFERDVRTEYRLVPGPIFRRKRASLLEGVPGAGTRLRDRAIPREPRTPRAAQPERCRGAPVGPSGRVPPGVTVGSAAIARVSGGRTTRSGVPKASILSIGSPKEVG